MTSLESLIALVQKQEATIGILEERDRQKERMIADLRSKTASLQDKLTTALAADSEISLLKGKNDALVHQLRQTTLKLEEEMTQVQTLKEEIERGAVPAIVDQPLERAPTPVVQEQFTVAPTMAVEEVPTSVVEKQMSVAAAEQAPEHQKIETHSPQLESGELKVVRNSSNTITPGSFKANMLGTACDLKHGEIPQPAGCYVSKEGQERCTTAKKAVRGLCALHTVAVPRDSPLGDKSDDYSVFRGLDPGTQIKLHLHRARSYWSRYGVGDGPVLKFPDDHARLVAKIASRRGGSYSVLPAFRHFYYAISILMHYGPSSENYSTLVAPDGVPYGAMSFFTPPEMQCAEEFIRAVAETDPSMLQGEPGTVAREGEGVIYSEILKSLSYEMKVVNIAVHYESVISNLAEKKEAVRQFLVRFHDAWTRLPNAQQIKDSDAAREIVEDGGKGNLEALKGV